VGARMNFPKGALSGHQGGKKVETPAARARGVKAHWAGASGDAGSADP
jgi:hypothetical protein